MYIIVISLVDFNNKVCIQWGRGAFTTGGTNETAYNITLPTSVTSRVTAVINADVGSSGWTYLNGICVTSNTTSRFSGRYCLGKVTNTQYTWICIGY